MPVRVNVSSQLSNVATYSFYPPTISSLRPQNGPTQGGTPVTLIGTNLGVGYNYSLSLGFSAVAPADVLWFNHTTIIFVLPRGVGHLLPVVLEVATQSTQTTYDYTAPVISNVSGCSGDAAPHAIDCGIGAGGIITIEGV